MQRVMPTLLSPFTSTGSVSESIGRSSLTFMQISREGMALFITQHSGDCPVGALVHLYVPDVDAWYGAFKRKGVQVHEAPNESLQGLRTMTILDPDGNKLRICTRLKNWKR
jgi:hypothetical protein